MYTGSPVVMPSSMKLHTPLVPKLIARNPSLAQDVINALNQVDRGRNRLFQSVMGPPCTRFGWRSA